MRSSITSTAGPSAPSLPADGFIGWLGVGTSKFHDWQDRYGKANEHNGLVPRDWWLEDWEKQAILDFHAGIPGGLPAAGLHDARRRRRGRQPRQRLPRAQGGWPAGSARKFSPSKKGTGFVQPLRPHEHWHVDVSYINVAGTFYYLCSLLDGCSRYIVHWEIRESMTEADVETIIQRAAEKFPDAKPRIITDNGPQFIAKDFKEFIRLMGMTHVRTTHTIPRATARSSAGTTPSRASAFVPRRPLRLEDARRLVAEFVEHYNDVRLHSAIGYVTPADKLNGLATGIFAERDRKLEAARQRRQQARQAMPGGCLMRVARATTDGLGGG